MDLHAYQPYDRLACVNGFVLKLIAVATMLVDHIGAVLFPEVMVLRYIGRIAFPIYVFLLVEGFVYTKNLRLYEARLLIFALLSEIPFDLAFSSTVLERSSQNVFFTLFLGLMMLDFMERMQERRFMELLLLVLFAMIASLFATDYSAGGIVFVYIFWKYRDHLVPKFVMLGVLAFVFYGKIECWCLLGAIPMFLYNGKRGFDNQLYWYGKRAAGAKAKAAQYVFYLFYPVHLLLLAALAFARQSALLYQVL